MGKANSVLAVLVGLLVLISALSTITATAEASPVIPPAYGDDNGSHELYARAEVAAKRLFKPTTGKLTAALERYVETGVLPRGAVVRNGKLTVAIFARKDVDLLELARLVKVYTIVDLGVGYMVVAGVSSPSALKAVASFRSVGRIIEDVKLNWDKLLMDEGREIDLMREAGLEPMNFKAREIMEVDKVEEVFGINGSGVTIAICDTGVDYAAYDLVDSLDRDPDGTITVFDPGAICVAFTNYTFEKTPDGYLPISSRPYYWVYWGGYYLRTDKKYFFVDFTKLPPLQDIYVGNITSLTGKFKFGILFEFGPRGETIGWLKQVYLCVVADTKPDVPGYDTLYIDFDTSLWLTAKLNEIEGYVKRGLDITTGEFEQLADWDITDEQPHYWRDPENNSEILARDINGDGLFDVSAGVLANVWALFVEPIGCRLLRGIDPSGNWVGVVYDRYPHGTACATSAAGRGRIGYEVFENGTRYKMYGMARGAKIMALMGFTRVEMWLSWLWACGWDVWDEEWSQPFLYYVYTGKHKADIISNSWGWVYFDLDENATQGFYWSELFIDLLTPPGYVHPDYPGTLFLVSGGNEGPGYGSIGAPSVSPAAFSIGATTSYHIWEKDYGRPQPYDEVVAWSSRGPTVIGLPKPDVATMGAYGFSAYPLMREARQAIANQWNCWGWFGGTSMSCPLAAGVCALVIQAYKQAHGHKPTPDVVKYIIESTADDLGYGPLTQGSGRINAYRAVAAALGLDEVDGEPIVLAYSSQSFKEAAKRLDKAFRFWWGPGGHRGGYWHGETISTHPGLAGVTLYDTSLYFWAKPGTTVTATVYAKTPSGQPIDEAEVFQYVLWDRRTVVLGNTGGKVYCPFVLTEILGEEYMEEYFYQADYVVLAVNYDFDVFMKFYQLEPELFLMGRARYPYCFLFDWEDKNRNGVIDMPGTRPGAPGEARRIMAASRGANVLTMYVTWPAKKFHRYNATGTWRGPTILFHDTGPETGPLRPWPGMDVRLTLMLFKRGPWDWATVEREGSITWRVTVRIPEDAMPGLYTAYVAFKRGNGTALMPITVMVAGTAPKGPDWLTFGNQLLNVEFEPWAFYGQYDVFYYPMASDFRVYPIYVTDDRARFLVTKITWQEENTHIGVYIVNETGQLADMSNMTWWVDGKGWVGTPTMPKGQWLITPIRGAGLFYIVLQVVRFDGDRIPEPITVSVCYLTEAALPRSTPAWSVSEGARLEGPHADVSVSWEQVSLSQLPEFGIKAVELRAFGGHYNKTWLYYRGRVKEGDYEFWYECELYAYQNFTEGQVAYIEVGWNKTYRDTMIDVFVWAPGVNQTYRNSLTGWQTTRWYHNNPQRGWFKVPTTGTYTIGIDIWWAGVNEDDINITGIWVYVLTSVVTGGRVVFNGTSASIDTQVARRNGKIYLVSRALTYTNIIYEARTYVFVHNFFKPEVELLSPTPGSTLSGVVTISWSIKDKNTDETHYTDVYVSLDGGQTWKAIAYGVTGTSVEWDTRPGSPAGINYTDKAMIKLVVSDGKYSDEEVVGYFTIDNRGPGGGPAPPPGAATYIAIGSGVAAAAAIAGYLLWRRRSS